MSVAALVGPEGKVFGIDPVPEMVAAARRATTYLGIKNSQFDVAYTHHLPFPADTFDAVVSRFGVMFFPSPVKAVREILRVLKPGRKLALAVWHFAERNPFFYTVERVVEQYVDSPPRDVRPHRAEDSDRWLMAHLIRLFNWRSALVVVKPDTLIRWHRKGFRLFWRWKSKPTGRPSLPKNLQELIRKMAAENPTWGEEHIANELKLKLGVRVSPRTVRKYLANYRGRTPDPSQRWLTFVHNHAQAIVACDFFVVFTARFRILYVFVIIELGRRQILHHNVTAHPNAEWTLQQFREALTEEHPYRFLIHDRDSIFSKDLDQAVTAMGVRILKTPVRAPKANAFCERLVGTIRRECLDFLIPFRERHLKQVLTLWAAHYNHARVHTSLGPGIPDPIRPSPPIGDDRHRLPAGHVLRTRAVLGGLHHEYWLEKTAA